MSFKKFNFVTRLLGTTKYFRSQELKGKKLVCRSPGSWSGWTWPDGPDPAAPGPRRCPNETLLKKNRIEIDLFQRDSDDGSLFDELDVFISLLFLLRFLFAFATSAVAACFGAIAPSKLRNDFRGSADNWIRKQNVRSSSVSKLWLNSFDRDQRRRKLRLCCSSDSANPLHPLHSLLLFSWIRKRLFLKQLSIWGISQNTALRA